MLSFIIFDLKIKIQSLGKNNINQDNHDLHIQLYNQQVTVRLTQQILDNHSLHCSIFNK